MAANNSHGIYQQCQLNACFLPENCGTAYQLKRPPGVTDTGDLEQHEFGGPERIDVLQRHCCNDTCDESTPHNIIFIAEGEGIKLFKSKQHTAKRAPERNRNACCGCGCKELAFLGCDERSDLMLR